MVDLSPAIKAAESGYEYAVKCGSVEEVASVIESAKEQFSHLIVHCYPESAKPYLELGQKVAVSVGLYRRGEISWASDPGTYTRGHMVNTPLSTMKI